MISYFLGIDPGKSGGAALITESCQVVTTIKFSETEADIVEWFCAIAEEYKGRISGYIEYVHAMPKQGVTSSFKFGQSYGFLRGILHRRIRFETVTPAKWQKVLGCLSRGNKNVTKARAQELFPHVKVIHAIADALLLAEFARRSELGK